jgi:hypothetical protein
MAQNFRRLAVLILLSLVVSGGLAACSGDGAGGGENDVAMASLEGAPREVLEAPVTVRQAYQFAVANPEVLTKIPCYCGCGAMGHTSNYSCYVAGAEADGKVIFDSHALGCSICVDITQDTMRMLKEGKDVPEISDFVDTTYAQYGPSNMP